MGQKPNEGKQAHEAQSALIKRKRSEIPFEKNDEKKQKIATNSLGRNCIKKKEAKIRKETNVARLGGALPYGNPTNAMEVRPTTDEMQRE